MTGWVNRGETPIYTSDWVSLATADVLLPDGGQVDHHLVRMPGPAAATIVVRDGAVLMLYRHRFITDRWGWEIPAGRVDAGERPIDTARRETVEETGWDPATITPLCEFDPAPGILDQRFHVFVGTDPVQVGPPTDTNESSRIEWIGVEELRRLLLSGQIPDGFTFGAIAYAFTAGALSH